MWSRVINFALTGKLRAIYNAYTASEIDIPNANFYFNRPLS